MVSIRRRRLLKEKISETPLPQKWRLVHLEKPDGEIVKCYTNDIGQKFFTMEDLLRYVAYAEREKVSIYKPGFDKLQLPDTPSESEGLDSSEEEEKREEFKKASTTDPSGASKSKKQVGDTSTGKNSSSIPEISSQIATTGVKLDESSTSSSYKGKGIATSSQTRPTPSRASRRLAGCDPEVAPCLNLQKARELKTKNDQIISGVQGEKLASNE
ncbi:hypothetical protein ACH5RR_000225 [Cinchona calisaya]|uniref:MBD domain-containing protein n=1 Tax=Cinchona calisaya TaxID=153742 RepID=A0ABD3B072_9GENT